MLKQLNAGYSLFELLITLAIITIVTTLTIPNYKTFLTHADSQTQRSNLQRALAFARSQAMLREVKVALCGASEDHQHCVEDWRNGVLIFTDTNGSAMITSPEQILYVIANSNHFGILHWRSSFKVNYLQIQPEGSTNGENGTFWYCPHHARAPSWALIVSLAGRARVALDETDLKKLLCA